MILVPKASLAKPAIHTDPASQIGTLDSSKKVVIRVQVCYFVGWQANLHIL